MRVGYTVRFDDIKKRYDKLHHEYLDLSGKQHGHQMDTMREMMELRNELDTQSMHDRLALKKEYEETIAENDHKIGL